LVPGTNGAYFNVGNGTAYIPAGDGLTYGYDGSMIGSDTALSVGISSFGFFANNSNPAVAVPYASTTAGTAAATKGALVFNGTNAYTFAPAFTPATSANEINPVVPKGSGTSAPTGSVGVTPIVSGYIGSLNSNPSGLPATYVPAGGAASTLLVSNLEFDLLSSTPGASTTISISNIPTAVDSYLTGAFGSYGGASTDGTTLTGATLTIVVAGGVTTTTTTSTTVSHQPIVTLLNTTPSTYGTQIGSPIVITGHNSSYTVGYTGTSLTQVGGQGYTTGYTAVSVFNPLTDTEVYALKLNASGAALSPTSTEIALIVADLNLGTGTGTAAVNVSAGAVVGSPYAALFPGYDILLVSTGAFGGAGNGGVADLGIDFSQDTDALTPGLVVTEVAAVPEPATAAGVVLGAAGLLLGRRKKQIATA
jgi:hypothetical protein